MELVTQTSLRAAQLVWRPGHGGFVLTVVCKATYALRPGTSPLAPTQQPITTADVYADGGALLAASDLVPFKKQPEALLTGHAYAPQGKRVTSFVVRFSVGEMDKAVQVVGDRTFGLDGRLSEPAPFTRMPLSWDRAFGGPETVNPVGRAVGAAAKPDAYGRALAPNLMPPDTDLASRPDNVAVMGFGPIAPHWPSRARCLHRHAQGWDPSRWNERPLPADIDLAYFNAAPPDQWRSTPFADEPIVLSNLHPLFGTLSTRLAAISPSAIVEREQGSEPLQLRCDTLLVDSDRGLAMLVWRGHVVLDHPDRPGRILVSHQESKSTPVVASTPVFDSTQADFAARASSTMPFADNASGAAPEVASSATPSAAPGLPPGGLLSGETVSVEAAFGSTMAFGFASAAPAVPFPRSGDVSAPARDPAAEENKVGLPFVAPSPEVSVADVPSPDVAVAYTASPDVSVAYTASSDVSVAEMSFPDVSVAEMSFPDVAVANMPVPGLPVTEMASTRSADAPPPAPVIDLDAYPPSRCGALAARLECNESTSADLLHAEDLDQARWEQIHEGWLDRIDQEASRGKIERQTEYDAGYVKGLEAERGPVTVAVYARLAAAMERDTLEDVLAELRFPEDAWLHVHRVFIGRMIREPKLGKEVRAAIAAWKGAS